MFGYMGLGLLARMAALKLSYTDSGSDTALHFTFYCLAGFAFSNTIVNILSLFMPIGNGVAFSFCGISLAAIWFYRVALYGLWKQYLNNLRQAHWGVWPAATLFFLTCLLKTASPSEQYDEGAYYIQSAWVIEHYGIITGLGNLHGHLALNSAWMAMNALWSFTSLHKGHMWNDLNGLFVLLCLPLWLTGLNNVLKGKAQLQHWAVCLMPAFLLRNLLTAPSADIPGAFTAWAILSMLLQKAGSESGQSRETEQVSNLKSLLIVMLCAYACTVKITLAPLAVPAFAMLWQIISARKRQPIIMALVSAAFIALPWLTRNVILSGYLIYPMPELGTFNFDWKVPETMAEVTRDLRMYDALPSHPLHPSIESLKHWWHSLTKPDKGLLIGLPLFFLPALVIYMPGKGSGRYLIWLAAIFAGLLFWWCTLPEVRFGLGFIIPAVCTGLAGLLILLKGKASRISAFGLAGLLTILVGAGTLKSYRELQNPLAYLVSPAPYPQLDYFVWQANGFTVNRPGNYLDTTLSFQPVYCWETPFPCFYGDKIPPHWVQARGPNLSDGFRIKVAEKAKPKVLKHVQP